VTDVGAGEVVPLSHAMNAKRVTWYAAFNQDVTAGVVRIETAHREDYAGAWSLIAEVDASNLEEGADHGTIDGPIGALRGSVTTQVAGGEDPGVTVVFLLAGDV
jgi:hypothetical protein